MKKVEICCGSVEDVMTASQFNIDSIELNCALELGGMTPSLSTLRQCKKITDVPLYCMVRPVPGGFHYNDIEFQTMLQEAEDLLENGADGIVFGILTQDLEIDQTRTNALIELAHSYQKEAVFHMAFDRASNLIESYKLLINLGIDRVLTSGGKNQSALENIDTLNEFHKINPDKFLVGAGLNPKTIDSFMDQCDANYLHGSCKENDLRRFGNMPVDPVYSQSIRTSKECVQEFVAKIKRV